MRTLSRDFIWPGTADSKHQCRSMNAVPMQTMESMEQTLLKTAELEPEHLSVYSLIVEEGTPFYDMKGLDDLLPTEDEDAAMYERDGKDRLHAP